MKIFTLLYLIFITFTLFGGKTIEKEDRDSLEFLLQELKGKGDKRVPMDRIKIWDSKNSVRVAFYMKQPVKFKYNLLKGEKRDRIYIDMMDAVPGSVKLPSTKGNIFLDGIRFGQKKGKLRVVLDTGKVEKYNVSVMDEPWRVVVDFYGKKEKRRVKKSKTKASAKGEAVRKEPENSVFTVVIDPGHGGKDPGAVYKKLYEKDLVLKLAKIIRKKAKKRKDIKVVLTRAKDKFLELEERAVIANRKDGDLFISLHVNSFKGAEAEGIEIYHLDNRRSKYTEKLAMVENRLTKKSSMLNTILVDMTMSYYIKDSLAFARMIGLNMKRDLKKHKAKIRDYRKGALFYVLVGARMPSLLVEIGFLSSKKDRKLLTNTKYLESLADTILDSVIKVKRKRKLVKNME